MKLVEFQLTCITILLVCVVLMLAKIVSAVT